MYPLFFELIYVRSRYMVHGCFLTNHKIYCAVCNTQMLKTFLNLNITDIQINKVDPVMEEKKQRFSGKPVCDQIVLFYRVNNIKKFIYSRPFVRKDPKIESNNEFAHMWLEQTELETTYPLPGILRWFKVEKTTSKEISPLRNAIDILDKTNKELLDYITMYNKDRNIHISLLSMKLKGTFVFLLTYCFYYI